MYEWRSFNTICGYNPHQTDNSSKKVSVLQFWCYHYSRGCISIVQPMDRCIDRPFKEYMRASWQEWMQQDWAKTKKGKLKQPTSQDVINWVSRTRDSIKPEILTHSFLSWNDDSLCRQLEHKKLILSTFRLDALILLKCSWWFWRQSCARWPPISQSGRSSRWTKWEQWWCKWRSWCRWGRLFSEDCNRYSTPVLELLLKQWGHSITCTCMWAGLWKGRNRERKCYIPHISPPTVVLMLPRGGNHGILQYYP